MAAGDSPKELRKEGFRRPQPPAVPRPGSGITISKPGKLNGSSGS